VHNDCANIVACSDIGRRSDDRFKHSQIQGIAFFRSGQTHSGHMAVNIQPHPIIHSLSPAIQALAKVCLQR
jgi:hypothetical protein